MDELNRKTFVKLVAAAGAMSVAAGDRAENATPAFG